MSDYSDETIAELRELMGRYPEPRSALLPMLHLLQSVEGRVTTPGIALCAELLDLSDAEVSGVATFYTMYKKHPVGKHHVGVCTNTLCAVMGGDAILDALQEHLGIHAGQSTADGSITLEHIECNAACDYAPVLMVNWEFFDNQTPSSARDLVDALQAGPPPTPSRSGSLCTFRETARILAGMGDSTGVDDTAGAGAATLAGLRIAREHGMSAPDAGAPATDSVSAVPGHEQAEATEAVKDEPAPAPSAEVPARGRTADTDPTATDTP